MKNMKHLKTFETYYYLDKNELNDTDNFTETQDFYKNWPKGSWVAFKNKKCAGVEFKEGELIRKNCKDIITYGILERIDAVDLSGYGEFASHTCQYRIKYKPENGGDSQYECINNLLYYTANSKEELEAKIDADKYNV